MEAWKRIGGGILGTVEGLVVVLIISLIRDVTIGFGWYLFGGIVGLVAGASCPILSVILFAFLIPLFSRPSKKE